ncbi:MAG: CARDB domain-containing protein [Alphaproteobacteria bacterium]
MSISAPSSTNRGNRFTVSATVSNSGGGVASGYSVRLDWSPSGSADLESTRTQSLPDLAAGDSANRSWTMEADEQGTLNLTVTLRDNLNNVILTRNASLTINR